MKLIEMCKGKKVNQLGRKSRTNGLNVNKIGRKIKGKKKIVRRRLIVVDSLEGVNSYKILKTIAYKQNEPKTYCRI